MRLNGVTHRTHRLSYEMMKGEIPSGLVVCHKCDNTACVNPDHLFLGTSSQNRADAVQKNRHIHGELHHKAKITEGDVRDIWALIRSGAADYEIAPLFGISRFSITKIRIGKNWKHLYGKA